jgi:Gpi18-like mannosyltransferase
MMKRFTHAILLAIIPTLLIWLPFFFRWESVLGVPLPEDGMATVVANYDGPLYIVVAKTLYDPTLAKTYPFDIPSEYYAAHFPLFPLLIKVFAFALGFPYAMLFVTLLSSIFAIYFFGALIGEFVEKKHVGWLMFLFALLPARWLIVRSIGSPEPLFLGAIIASVYYFRKNKYVWAGVFGAIAQLTKSPAILLFVAYGVTILAQEMQKLATISSSKWLKEVKIFSYIPLFLIPLALISVFYLYKIQMSDFFAYFHSGDNIHLLFPPFQIFNYTQSWVGTFWLEDIIFIYLFGALGIAKLIQQKEEALYWFAGILFLSLLFVSHRDIIRYGLPIVPFLLIAFRDTLISREFKFTFALLIIPIYLLSLAFISQNVMPISNWAPLI